VPGMDELTYVEVDYEEDIRVDLMNAENDAMKAYDPYLTVAPWPVPIPRHAPLDYTMRYDGLQFVLHHWDQFAEDFCEVPGGMALIDSTDVPLDRDHQRLSRELNVGEVRGWPDMKQATRLPFPNETGGTDLKEPVAITYYGPKDCRFALELPDNNYFTPFDLTHPERYILRDSDGTLLEDGWDFLRPGADATRVLYLRPRRMRWIVTVIAHYLWVTWFEEAYNDEVFISVFYQRPPFYPMRHNLGTTTKPEAYQLFNFYGEPRSEDNGLTSSWELSWHSIDLREQILDQQWFSLCEAYEFIGNEDPDLALVAYPPRVGEIVLGVGIVDRASGREDVVWVYQKEDASSVYPQRTVGEFLLPEWQA
jgi:hypothetical protein